MADEQTVEWGERRRARLIDRLIGPSAAPGPRRPALVCAVASVALFVAAEVTPWSTITKVSLLDDSPLSSVARDAPVDEVSVGAGIAYHLGVLVLLTVVGVALASRASARRPAAAAGLGLAAGLLVLTVGLIDRAGSDLGLGIPYEVESRVGPGPFVAIAAQLAAAAAVTLAAWHRRPARPGKPAEPDDVDDPDDDEPGPIDLTVSSG